MKGLKQQSRCIASLTGMIVVAPTLAFSAVAEVPAPADTLEVITVTAQKRTENLQNTPIAITAVTAAAIQSRGLTNISEVQNFTPNLRFDTTAPVSGVSSGAVIFLRGIGQTDFALTTEPGVGTYVDGVYASRSVGGVLDVLDLERIEVLRGPQGTLFGRNTIGGAISLVTQNPSTTQQGDVSVTTGSFSRLDLRASVDLPLSDQLLTRLTVSSKTRDGYVHDLIDERRLGDENRQAARFKMLYAPSENFKATLVLDGSRIREQNAADKLVGISIIAPGAPTRTDYVYNQHTQGVDVVTRPNAPGNPNLAFLYNVFDAPATNIPGFGNAAYDGRWITPDIDRTYSTGPNGTRLNAWGGALTLDWKFDALQLKSISAYRETSGYFNRDADGSPLTVTHTENYDYGQTQFSQELQATANHFEGALKSVGGVYLFSERGRDFLNVVLPPSFAYLQNNGRVKNDSYAAYLQETWSVTDAFSLTAGIRYTKDRKTFLSVANTFTLGPVGAGAFGGAPGDQLPLIPVGPGAKFSESFSNTSPHIGVQYNWNESLMTYASYSKGFKSGGFNIRYLVPRASVAAFAPERVATAEVGSKWEGFERRLRINAAVFSTTYKDIQLIVYEQGAPIIQNAGEARIKGAEIEISAVPMSALQLSASAGYLDAYYVKVNPTQSNVTLDQQITPSTQLPKTPRWSLSASAEYSRAVSAQSEGFLRADWSYMTKSENDAVNSYFLTSRAHGLLNAALGMRALGGRWETTLGINNATDTRFIASGDSNYGIGFHEANFNRPREWSLGVKLHLE